MLSYEDARTRLLHGAERLAGERVPLSSARGRLLSDDLIAALTQPPFPASAMDGYAIRWADMPGPWKVIGESAAGRAFAGHVGGGAAVRIFTGAPVPDGADTVVVQEDVRRSGPSLTLIQDGPLACGAHIRPRGNDFNAGDMLLPAGTRVTAAAVGLAGAAGHDGLHVIRKPRVAIIATGDELVPPGTAPGPGQIVAGNGAMLAGLLEGHGAAVTDMGIVPDDRVLISAALETAADHDLVLTIGGASVGDHDLVKDALSDAGAHLDFWRIAIKPGKPLIAGMLGKARLIGLPGNPVSAFVCALLFAVPIIRVMQGYPDEDQEVEAILTAGLPANGDRRDHLRAVYLDGTVKPVDTQDSAQLAVLAKANALIIRPPSAEAAHVGETVSVLLLDRT